MKHVSLIWPTRAMVLPKKQCLDLGVTIGLLKTFCQYCYTTLLCPKKSQCHCVSIQNDNPLTKLDVTDTFSAGHVGLYMNAFALASRGIWGRIYFSKDLWIILFFTLGATLWRLFWLAVFLAWWKFWLQTILWGSPYISNIQALTGHVDLFSSQVFPPP